MYFLKRILFAVPLLLVISALAFSPDGKTTYQMKAIKAGQYVKIYYDQKMLGQRHADRILLLAQNNGLKGKQ